MKTLALPRLKDLYKRYFLGNQNYLVGKYSIVLPSNHLLPIYQNSHKLYDVFLGFLAKYLPANSYAIDIGANCGDSLAIMASNNSDIHFLCVEADEYFFEFLNTNAGIIANNINKHIYLVNAFVGTLTDNVVLREVVPGTKRPVITSQNDVGLASEQLDDIICKYIEDTQAHISLIKIDTDGFDYDVINSSPKLIGRDNPILFFECFFTCSSQLEGYRRTLVRLGQLGYSYFLVFDNFGAFMFETTSILHIHNLLDYISDQSCGHTTKTLEYIDVVASCQSFQNSLNNALSDFQHHVKG